MTSRREFFVRVAGGSAAILVAAQRIGAQQRGMIHDSMVVRDSTNLFAMDQSAAREVRLPPKPGAVPLLTDRERDDLEHRLHCQCGCTLDVFTCRTTDFSCQVSPAMHRDVLELVRGGYSAQEIIDAFVGTYGERALMAPRKSGFNLLAWIMPGIMVVAGGVAVSVLVRRWGTAGAKTAADRERTRQTNAPSMGQIDATPDELARLEAAVKGEDKE